jgi:hypothetical protein
MAVFSFWLFKKKTNSTFLEGSAGGCAVVSKAPMPTQNKLIEQIEIYRWGKGGLQINIRLETGGKNAQGCLRWSFSQEYGLGYCCPSCEKIHQLIQLHASRRVKQKFSFRQLPRNECIFLNGPILIFQ